MVPSTHAQTRVLCLSLDFPTRHGNTSTIEAIFLHSGCGRVVQGAGHKTKRLVLQCINGVSSNSVEGRIKICQLKDLILTLFGFHFQTYIYIYMISLFLNKPLEYIDIENYKAIYKYIQLQGNRNGHIDQPGSHTNLFMG